MDRFIFYLDSGRSDCIPKVLDKKVYSTKVELELSFVDPNKIKQVDIQYVKISDSAKHGEGPIISFTKLLKHVTIRHLTPNETYIFRCRANVGYPTRWGEEFHLTTLDRKRKYDIKLL